MKKPLIPLRPRTIVVATILGLAAGTLNAPAFAQTPGEGGTSSPDCSGTTIGATLLDLDYPFLGTLNDSMAAEAQRLGAELVVGDPRKRVEDELTQIQDLISQRVDAIIMIPVDGVASQIAAKEVNTAGIPLIEVGTKLSQTFFDDGGTIATYVGSLDLAGAIQGQHIIKRGNPVRVIYLVDEEGGASTDLRREGFTRVMGEHRGLSIVVELDAHGSRAEAEAMMDELLQVYGVGAFDGVVSQDDDMVLGALAAIEASDRLDEFSILMGIGAGPAALESIEDGGLTASVFQDAVGQGIGAVQAACRIMAGEDVPPTTVVPFQLVTSDNVDQFSG